MYGVKLYINAQGGSSSRGGHTPAAQSGAIYRTVQINKSLLIHPRLGKIQRIYNYLVSSKIVYGKVYIIKITYNIYIVKRGYIVIYKVESVCTIQVCMHVQERILCVFPFQKKWW